MATGKYIKFVEPLIKSAQKYFCINHDVTFFIFTDDQHFQHPNAIKIFQKKLGWPHDTLKRFEIYYKNKNIIEKMDYLFASDSDMLFADYVGNEILSERVATFHPGFYKRKIELPYERNNFSTAFIKKEEDKYYFAGGFYGGTTEEFLKLIETTSNNIFKDLQSDYISIWHDESHLNRYFIDNPPTLMLNPSYCYPEDVAHLAHDDYKSVINLPKKLIALAKKHDTFQETYQKDNI